MAIYLPAMPILPMPDPVAVHGVTMAFAKAAESMAPADLWLARIAIKTLHRDQREAIAEAAED